MRLVFLVLVGFVVVSVLAIGSMLAAMGMNVFSQPYST